MSASTPPKRNSRQGLSTRAIHLGYDPATAQGALTPPIYQTSTYAQDGLGRHKGYEYARTQNPTRAALEKNIAALEGAQQDDEIRRLIGSKDAAEREFLRLTREVVIVGYFTSEKIGKTLLRYEPVPGRYDADIPLSETGGAAWNRP